jgi:molybdate transport system ATP-binding protein
VVTLAEAIGAAMLSVAIRKRFSPATAACSFHLQITQEFPAGFTVLFGPSGAGKSTLLDCIAGLTEPDQGVIRLGEEVFFDAGAGVSMAPHKRAIGYVFQSLALFPHLSVEQNVAFGLAGIAPADRRDRIDRILSAFHIVDLRGRKPEELSGGEKQRVALARSLATEPRLLLLDEPLTGLDAGLRRAILQDLREWNDQRRIPTLYVTHNREEVDAIGERVVALVAGQVRESGLPKAVLDQPRSMALAQSAGFENLLAGRVLEQRAADGVMRIALDGNRCELEIPLGEAKPGDPVQVAIHAGDILLAGEVPRALSARNVLHGVVESVEIRGAIVAVRVNAGARFLAHVTPAAVRSLELRSGLEVWLVVKTYSCHAITRR